MQEVLKNATEDFALRLYLKSAIIGKKERGFDANDPFVCDER